MVRHSVEYQQLLKDKQLAPGRFLSVEAAEYLSGLPRGWSSPAHGAVDAKEVLQSFPEGKVRLRSSSLKWQCA